MNERRQELVASINTLAEECIATGETEAGSVLKALVGAMWANQEAGLMEHVKQFSWRLLKQVAALRN